VRKTIVACVAVALIVGATSATAATLITGKQIKDGTITADDIKRGSINKSRLAGRLQNAIEGVGAQGRPAVPGAAGVKGDAGGKGDKGDKGDKGVAGLESDGPYPGATDLGTLPGQGDNSGDMWAAGGTRQTSWVQCAPGKTALGGGFHLAADAGDAAAKAVQVVVSEPTQINAGAVVYEPIDGDAAGSIKPNGWLVQGFNDGTGPVVVRPWVVCADVD
jgi:hypothetical protein